MVKNTIEGYFPRFTLVAVEMWDQSSIFDKEKVERKPKAKLPVDSNVDSNVD